MDICHGWYAALSSREVTGSKPFAFRRFGTDLVAWRDEQGRVAVMQDMCPHRSAKLSLGRVSANCIVCPFHGFEFATDGDCRLVPETAKPAPNLQCTVFPSREQHGLIWIWYGDSQNPTERLPWFEELTDDFKWIELKEEWTAHVTRCIENQLDYAHLPFVHKTTIGANFDLKTAQFDFELADESICLNMGQGFFEFKFPNIWQLQIVARKFYQFIAFAPVDDTTTVIYLRAYQRFVTLPVLRDLVGFFMKLQSSRIIAQDKRVVLSHPVVSSLLSATENLYPSDAGIAHFRKKWCSNKTS